ncbi:MAG TPA: alanine racemase [Vicinamibacterales bacterium]|nr:alanine racemase [Vicinamibacterales bacterium]
MSTPKVTALATPQILVENKRVHANIERMQHAARERGIRLRPHAKTHKIPQIAQLQIQRGAVGICCAKVGEAEVFAAAGIRDIRLPYPVHPVNASRVRALMSRAQVSIIVDDLDVAGGWSDAMLTAGQVLDVLVKVDVGFHRCGIDPEAREAADMIKAVADLPGLRLQGLLSHAGHAYGAKSERELRDIARRERDWLTKLAERAELEAPEISVGATPTARFSLELDGITELRPGNYVYFDRTQVGLGAARPQDCALTVLARVVSRPAPDRVILDCGSKTLTADGVRGFAGGQGFGAVLVDLESDEIDEDLVIERLSEEHATVRVGRHCRLRTGDLVRVLPNHSCVVSNMVDFVQLVDGIDLLETLRVEARGRIT